MVTDNFAEFRAFGYAYKGEDAYGSATAGTNILDGSFTSTDHTNWAEKDSKKFYWPSEGKVTFFGYSPSELPASKTYTYPAGGGYPTITYTVNDAIASQVDFLVTQMFFDNDEFYKFRDKLAKKGINKPITAGIMPLTNAGQIQRMAILSGGASMPSKFLRMISKYQDNPEALKQAGIAYAVDQIIDLLSNDIDGIHLYTMNKPETAQKIVNVINNLFV